MSAGPGSPVVLVAVASFHHQRGNEVEWSHPPLAREPSGGVSLPPEWAQLAFLALPDNCHSYEADTVFFQVPLPASLADAARARPGAVLHGVSCVRRIRASALASADVEVTRSHVQKAVLVLSLLPVYSLLEARASIVARAFFADGRLNETALLVTLLDSLNATLAREPSATPAAYVWENISPVPLVRLLAHDVLSLVKLVLLERRVVVWSARAGFAARAVLAIASLFPGSGAGFRTAFNMSLDSALDGELPRGMGDDDEPAREAEFVSLALPLRLYAGAGHSVRSLVALQQLDSVETLRAFLIGTSNALIARGEMLEPAAVLNLDDGTLTVLDDALFTLLQLTAADLRFSDMLVRGVERAADARARASAGAGDGAGAGAETPTGDERGADDAHANAWVRAGGHACDMIGASDDERVARTQVGSDSWVRARVEAYVVGLVATLRAAEPSHLRRGSPLLDLYGMDWVQQWAQTSVYNAWRMAVVSPAIGSGAAATSAPTEHAVHPAADDGGLVTDFTLQMGTSLRRMRVRERVSWLGAAVGRTAVSVGARLSSLLTFTTPPGQSEPSDDSPESDDARAPEQLGQRSARVASNQASSSSPSAASDAANVGGGGFWGAFSSLVDRASAAVATARTEVVRTFDPNAARPSYPRVAVEPDAPTRPAAALVAAAPATPVAMTRVAAVAPSAAASATFVAATSVVAAPAAPFAHAASIVVSAAPAIPAPSTRAFVTLAPVPATAGSQTDEPAPIPAALAAAVTPVSATADSQPNEPAPIPAALAAAETPVSATADSQPSEPAPISADELARVFSLPPGAVAQVDSALSLDALAASFAPPSNP